MKKHTIGASVVLMLLTLTTGCNVNLGGTLSEDPVSCTTWSLQESHYQSVTGCEVPSGNPEDYLVTFFQSQDILEIELHSKSNEPVPALDFVQYRQYLGNDKQDLKCTLVEFPTALERVYECYLQESMSFSDNAYEIESIQFKDSKVGCEEAVVRFDALPQSSCPLARSEISHYNVYYRGFKVPFLHPKGGF